jgi:hypothetical protein
LGLKQYFGLHKEGSYYQGLNEVLGFLLQHFTYKESLIILEGLETNFLWDFTNLPFSECLVPVLKAIQHVLGWKKPEWAKAGDNLFVAVQSEFGGFNG